MPDTEFDALAGHDVVMLTPGVRLHHDAVRGVDVLLAPERAVGLDEIGVAIIRAIDGVRSLDQLAAALAAEYEAAPEEVFGDMMLFVDAFIERGLLRRREPTC